MFRVHNPRCELAAGAEQNATSDGKGDWSNGRDHSSQVHNDWTAAETEYLWGRHDSAFKISWCSVRLGYILSSLLFNWALEGIWLVKMNHCRNFPNFTAVFGFWQLFSIASKYIRQFVCLSVSLCVCPLIAWERVGRLSSNFQGSSRGKF